MRSYSQVRVPSSHSGHLVTATMLSSHAARMKGDSFQASQKSALMCATGASTASTAPGGSCPPSNPIGFVIDNSLAFMYPAPHPWWSDRKSPNRRRIGT